MNYDLAAQTFGNTLTVDDIVDALAFLDDWWHGMPAGCLA